MDFYTEKACTSLEALEPAKAIRAIHRALLQLEAGEKLGFDCMDNADTISALRACMLDAGHVGYTPALTADALRAAVTLGLEAQGLEG